MRLWSGPILVAGAMVLTRSLRTRAARSRALALAPGPADPAGTFSRQGFRAAGVLEDLLARRADRRARSELAAAAPLTFELVRMGASAGLVPQQALSVAARTTPGEAGSHLRRVDAALGVGATLSEALEGLRRSAPELSPLADAVESARQLGTDLGRELAGLAVDARADLRRAAEARARTVPVRLLFPLVFLVLPSFVLLGIVPALLGGTGG